MFRALASADVNIQMISTSEIKISCVVDAADGKRALAAVHQVFGLENVGGPNDTAASTGRTG
jgi:aspartate kinase